MLGIMPRLCGPLLSSLDLPHSSQGGRACSQQSVRPGWASHRGLWWGQERVLPSLWVLLSKCCLPLPNHPRGRHQDAFYQTRNRSFREGRSPA